MVTMEWKLSDPACECDVSKMQLGLFCAYYGSGGKEGIRLKSWIMLTNHNN